MDRLQQLEKELEGLKASVNQLQEEISALRYESHKGRIQAFLSQRGLPVLSHDDDSYLLLSPRASQFQKEKFYSLMRRYSFRLFLRDLIKDPQGSRLNDLTRYCSLKTVQSYAKQLVELEIVAIQSDMSCRLLKPHVDNFGPTLEWYVGQIFKREFMAPSLFNVRFQNTPLGGDYDVLALVSGFLVWVEVKSSPPRGIEIQEITAFLNRLFDLRPHVAVFLVDTELRMRDKIVPHFEEALLQMPDKPNNWAVQPLMGEIFHVGHTIYLINSRKGIYTNLRYCLRDFLLWEKKSGLPQRAASM